MMRPLMQTIWLVSAVALGATSAHAEATKLKPVESRYELHMGPLTLGDARFSLEPTGEDCYRYQYIAMPQGIAKMFVGSIHEISDFCMNDAGMLSNMTCTCPPMRSVIAGACPRYGTCCRLTPVIILNISPVTCWIVPVPADAILSLPGFALA